MTAHTDIPLWCFINRKYLQILFLKDPLPLLFSVKGVKKEEKGVSGQDIVFASITSKDCQ